jgi:hypothetical protein
MSIRPFVLGLALASPVLAQAAHTVTDSVFYCTAAMSFSNTASLLGYCAGNFTISGGTWTSDTRIDLSAAGDITLNGVTMTAPIIEVQSLTKITAGSTTVLSATTLLNLQAPRLPTTTRDPASGRPEQQNLPSDVAVGAGDALIISDGGVLDVTAGGDSGNPRSFSDGGGTDNNPRVGGEIVIRIRGDQPVLQQASGSISQQPTTYTFTTTHVPEPESYALALVGLATGAALARRLKA